MKRKLIWTAAALTIAILIAVFVCNRVDKTDPKRYADLCSTHYQKVHDTIHPTWRVEDKVADEKNRFERCGDAERVKMYEVMQEKIDAEH